MEHEEQVKFTARRDAFSRIAFWQYMAFFFLLSFVWVIEVLDIPHRVFGIDPTPFNFYRACLLTSAVIAAAVVAIGHTYEQQRSLLRKLLKTCVYCHRVKIAPGSWEHVDEYFIKHYPVAMERGTCPLCEEMLTRMNEENNNFKADLIKSQIETAAGEVVGAAKAS